jgi:hypothetical protein
MQINPCAFCGAPSSLLCDGRLVDGKTCDKRICRRCAGPWRAHVSLQLKNGRRGGDTRDLCPDCAKAGRDIVISGGAA